MKISWAAAGLFGQDAFKRQSPVVLVAVCVFRYAASEHKHDALMERARQQIASDAPDGEFNATLDEGWNVLNQLITRGMHVIGSTAILGIALVYLFWPRVQSIEMERL